MIYDPSDVNMAMDEHGTLFYRTSEMTGQVGAPEWSPLNELNRNGDFRRPEW